MKKSNNLTKFFGNSPQKMMLFTLILLLFVQTFSNISFDSRSNFQNQNFMEENKNFSLVKRDNPPFSSALDNPVFFVGESFFFLIEEKGILEESYYNFYYNDLYHGYTSRTYLSIDDEEPTSLTSYTIVKDFINLTEMEGNYFTEDSVGESILQHPDYDIFIKIQVKLFSSQNFFMINYMIWSDSISTFKAELFIYNDFDMDSYNIDGDETSGEYLDDYAEYDESVELIEAHDADSNNTIGWTSLESIKSWEIGDGSMNMWTIINNDALGNSTIVEDKDVSMITKYDKNSISTNQIWTVPLIYGFGNSISEVKTNTVDIKDEFINDFSVLDFTPDLSGKASVNATIMNCGNNTQTRNVSIYTNGYYAQSEEITLSPGEIGYINFVDVDLISQLLNEITVSVNNSDNDYDFNDEVTQSHMYYNQVEFNVKDLAGNNVEGINASLYLQSNSELEQSILTDVNGNVTFMGLESTDFELELSIPWMEGNSIFNFSFSYPDDGNSHILQTNITTMRLQINDVSGNPVNNATIKFRNNFTSDIIWSTTTDSNGNVTFQYLNGSYDIGISYFNYDSQLPLGTIEDFDLIKDSFLSRQVNLTTLILHVSNLATEDPLERADVQIYHSPTPNSFGINIGKEKTDSNGNVSIIWSSLLNYSIRVMLSGSFCDIDISGVGYDAMNYTDTPYTDNIYSEIKINLAGYEQFAPELTLFNSLPLSYTWMENIEIFFMLNVTDSNNQDQIGPTWASETEIIVRNVDYEIIFSGEAVLVPGEVGNHSLILNTTSGYFTSGNPETYSVEIAANLDSYLDPTPISFVFNIFNITTELESSFSTNSLIWKDNFTITTTYETIGGTPLIDGIVSITWGNYLEEGRMQHLGNGIYSIEINSSIGDPGSYKLEIFAQAENHFSQKNTINLFVGEVPTAVNGSGLFDSRHAQYVTTQNLSFQYYFIDIYRNISVPNEIPTYELLCDETEMTYTGNLIYNNSGFYEFDPHTADFPIGNYHGLIWFEATHHDPSFASIQIEITAIPTQINDTTIPDIPYDLKCYQSFSLDFELINLFNNSSVINSNATYEIGNLDIYLEYSGTLVEIIPGLYRFQPNTENIPIGAYSITIIFSKNNFTTIQTQFTFIISIIPTTINDSSIITAPYELFSGEDLQFVFEYKDSFRNLTLSEANVTYVIDISDNPIDLTDNLDDLGSGLYRFNPQTQLLSDGVYSTTITFQKENYTTIQTQFIFIIGLNPTSINDSSILAAPYELYIGESLHFVFEYKDSFRDLLISEANVSYLIEINNNSPDLTGNLSIIAPGLYEFNPRTQFLLEGTYTTTITFHKENYTTQKTQFTFIIDLIPTIINDSSIQPSPYNLYIGENLQFMFEFKDSFRNTAISGGNITYIIDITDNPLDITGNLSDLGMGLYYFNPQTQFLLEGTYSATISFQKLNYTTTQTQFTFIIDLIPTVINDSLIQPTPYNLYIGENLQFLFEFKDSFRNISISEGNVTYIIEINDNPLDITGNLTDLGAGLYNFNPQTQFLLGGIYSATISFQKTNYSIQQTSFVFTINSIPTSINDSIIKRVPYELLIGENLEFDFEYRDTFWETPIENGEVNYKITKDNSDLTYSGILSPLDNGIYHFSANIPSFMEGTYFIALNFTKSNYTSILTSFTLKINKIPLIINFKGGMLGSKLNQTQANEYLILLGENFNFNMKIADIYNQSLPNCEITYLLEKEGIIEEGFLILDSQGIWSKNFSEFEEIGLYTLTILIQKTNYTGDSIQIYLNVEYPTILGISQPYFIIGGLSLLLMLSGVFGYAAIKRARIPRFIKDLNLLERILNSPTKELPDRYISREQQLKSKFSSRWTDFDLDFPTSQMDDELTQFIRTYNDATGKLLIKEDAKLILDDLAIYSLEEITARLQSDNISEKNLTPILDLIENYRKSIISDKFVTQKVKSLEDDEFDLDSLEPSSDGGV